jgi:ATP-dependent helicase/nuclease subunit B
VRRNVFTISPGAPFLSTFVEALLNGDIVPTLSRASPTLDVARATIYVPTQRAGRALATVFANAIHSPAALLPRILPLGGLDEQENAALFAAEFSASDLDEAFTPAIDEIERRLTLSSLVMQWTNALRHAVVSIDPTGAPVLDPKEMLLVAPNPATAYLLSGELAALIDEFIIENVDPGAVDTLTDGAFDEFWAITTRFLGIALKDWPKILQAHGLVDAATRQQILLEAQIAQPSQGAVIAIGSTGANPMTAKLLAAIARLEQGAVVLPGLDLALDDAAWELIGANAEQPAEPAYSHPQTLLKRLLSIIGVARDAVRELGVAAPALGARAHLVSHAMRPAETTAQWREFRATSGAQFADALAGVSLVEAPDERSEALTLALYMREALDTPGKTAALITPNRDIARRVAGELSRFGVAIDDSGGKPLAATLIGGLARLVAANSDEWPTAVGVAALLAHPLTALGATRAHVEDRAPSIEIAVLRVVGVGEEGWAQGVAAARQQARERHVYPAVKRLSDADWSEIETLLAQTDAAMKPTVLQGATARLRARVEAHRAALELLTARSDDAAIDHEGVAELFALFDELQRIDPALDFDVTSYAAFFDQLARETIVRGPRRAHPRLKILGPLEARLLDADLVLVAGLEESVWPPQAQTGAFLNRSMRRQLGLSPPERRIGQSAHDFAMALGARDVVISRSDKRDGSPTVASRFVTRLKALVGDAFAPCKDRGDRMLAIAAALDRPAETRSCKRPEPRPRIELRPQRLSVTRIETLRRDPYAIHAEYILKLIALAPLGAEQGARELGTAIHDAVSEFATAHPRGPLPPGADEELIALAREKLRAYLDDPAFLSFQWPRIRLGLSHVLAFERDRRLEDRIIHVEAAGEWRLTLTDGAPFIVSAYADRIEVSAAGGGAVFDFKTGATPSMPQVLAGLSPQLTLEAAMLQAGAFAGVGPQRAEGAAYVQIGGAGDGRPLWVKHKEKTFSEIVGEHSEQLVAMLNQYRREDAKYPSRPHVAFASRFSDYDHLARVKEWSRDGGEEAE